MIYYDSKGKRYFFTVPKDAKYIRVVHYDSGLMLDTGVGVIDPVKVEDVPSETK